MFKNFKEFAQEKLIQEVAGRSAEDFRIATEYEGLAVLLTLIQDGNAQKARVLNWVMGEGLMTASLNREKLLKEVQDVVTGYSSTIQYPKSITTNDRKLKVEMNRHAQGLYGFDEDHGEITAHDLFSPEAYKRIPILQQIDEELLMPGKKTISDYWMEKYEPKVIVVNDEDDQNSHSVYNLIKIRQIAESKGLTPFYYGGFNGFIQYVEKGDWRPDVMRGRSVVNPNNQDGVNISPEKVYDKKTGEHKLSSDVVSWTKDGTGSAKPIYHFQGGSYTVDGTRAGEVIQGMQTEFKRIAKLSSEPSDNLDDETKDQVSKISKILNFVKKSEGDLEAAKDSELDDEGNLVVTKRQRRKGSLARNIGIFSGAKGAKQRQLSPDIDVNAFRQWLQIGLSYPFGLKIKKNRRQYSASGRAKTAWLWDRFSNEQGGMQQIYDLLNVDENGNETINEEVLNEHINSDYGWFYKVPNKNEVIYKFSKQQQSELLNQITASLGQGTYESNVRLWNLPSFQPLFYQNREPVKNSDGQTGYQYSDNIRGADNAKLFINVIIENALESRPDIREKLKTTTYTIQGINPEEYTFKPANREITLQKANAKSDSVDMGDPTLQNLFNKGFEWESSKGNHPFKKENINKATLSNGRQRFLVEKKNNPDGGQVFVLVMPDLPEQSLLDSLTPREVKSQGSGGLALLGSKNILITSGQGGRHITGNALGYNDWQSLLSRLKRGCGGGLGEGEGCGVNSEPSREEVYHSEFELPCVIGGVTQAKRYFNSQNKNSIKFFQTVGNQLGGPGGKYPSDYYDQNELLSWAVEGLHLYSNDRAFQVGWIGDSEYNAFVGSVATKDIKKSRTKSGDQEKEYIKQDIAEDRGVIDDEDPDYFRKLLKSTRLPEKKDGFGFLALLRKYKALDDRRNSTPEERAEYQNDILQKLKEIQETQSSGNQKDKNQFGEKKLLIDYIWELFPEVAAAMARNGFEFRKRRIYQFVLSKMKWEFDKLKSGNAVVGFGAGKDSESGEEQSFEPVQGSVASRVNAGSGEFSGVQKQVMNPEELKALASQGTLRPASITGKSSQGAVGARQAPRITAKQSPVVPQAQGGKVRFVLNDEGELVPEPVQAQVTPVLVPKSATSSQTAAAQQVRKPKFVLNDEGELVPEHFKNIFVKKLKSFLEWRKNFQEMAGTYAIINPKKKPKDGDGFNIWGAAGKSGGVSITGEADSSEEDPTGEKDKANGTKSKRKR